MSITKLSTNWACQMGPIHFIKFLLVAWAIIMYNYYVQRVWYSAGPPRNPVLKVTNSRSSFGKSRKFPFRIDDLLQVNKLVSLTWLLWALRSFRSFTLHYITSKHVHYSQKD